jgi:uncharacterized protein (TIGR01777 family)
MRIVISGGTGMIGTALSESFLKDGYEVIVLSRDPRQHTGVPEGLVLQEWDARSPGEWASRLEDASAVIHMAGENLAGPHFFPSRWTQARKQLIIQSRIQSGEAIVKAIQLAKHKPAVLVQASGVGYYGTSLEKTFDETSAPGDDFLAEVGKQWESCTEPVEQMGVRRMVIRSGAVLSTRGGAFTRLVLPFKLFVGGPMGSGKQYIPWIHIADEVGAIRFLIENQAASGIYNLVAPQAVTNAEFGKTIAQVISRPYWFPIPAFAMRLAFGEVAVTVLEGQRVVPGRLQDLGYSYQYPDLGSAISDLLKK